MAIDRGLTEAESVRFRRRIQPVDEVSWHQSVSAIWHRVEVDSDTPNQPFVDDGNWPKSVDLRIGAFDDKAEIQEFESTA